MFEKVLFEKIPARLLLAIEEKGSLWNLSQISRRKGFAFPHVNKLIKVFLENNLITREKIDNNSYHLFLMEKGKELLSHIKEIKRVLND